MRPPGGRPRVRCERLRGVPRKTPRRRQRPPARQGRHFLREGNMPARFQCMAAKGPQHRRQGAFGLGGPVQNEVHVLHDAAERCQGQPEEVRAVQDCGLRLHYLPEGGLRVPQGQLPAPGRDEGVQVTDWVFRWRS